MPQNRINFNHSDGESQTVSALGITGPRSAKTTVAPSEGILDHTQGMRCFRSLKEAKGWNAGIGNDKKKQASYAAQDHDVRLCII
jgi:hypothetical protein